MRKLLLITFVYVCFMLASMFFCVFVFEACCVCSWFSLAFCVARVLLCFVSTGIFALFCSILLWEARELLYSAFLRYFSSCFIPFHLDLPKKP